MADYVEAYDAEVEWCLMNNIEPADHIAALTRKPALPIRLAPEQEACDHPEDLLQWNAYWGVFVCGECGAQLLIPEYAESLDRKIS